MKPRRSYRVHQRPNVWLAGCDCEHCVELGAWALAEHWRTGAWPTVEVPEPPPKPDALTRAWRKLYP